MFHGSRIVPCSLRTSGTCCYFCFQERLASIVRQCEHDWRKVRSRGLDERGGSFYELFTRSAKLCGEVKTNKTHLVIDDWVVLEKMSELWCSLSHLIWSFDMSCLHVRCFNRSRQQKQFAQKFAVVASTVASQDDALPRNPGKLHVRLVPATQAEARARNNGARAKCSNPNGRSNSISQLGPRKTQFPTGCPFMLPLYQ